MRAQHVCTGAGMESKRLVHGPAAVRWWSESGLHHRCDDDGSQVDILAPSVDSTSLETKMISEGMLRLVRQHPNRHHMTDLTDILAHPELLLPISVNFAAVGVAIAVALGGVEC